MDQSGDERIGGRDTHRSEGGTLGDLAQFIVDNPLLHQALQVALGARERASQASATAIRNLNLPTGNDVDRLARRLRGLSERLEAVEDSLDEINRQLAEIRRGKGAPKRRESSKRG